MPFTLITDLMLAVHPHEEYAKVKVKNEIWVMVQQRVEPTMKELDIQDYLVIDTFLGSELEGLNYEKRRS